MTSKNMLVVKSNRLVEASYRLTLVEQRIILFAIAQSRRTQKPLMADTLVVIKATDYAKMFDVSLNKAYEQLKEAEKLLFHREFTLMDTQRETGETFTLRSRWVSVVAHADKAGVIGLMFSPLILPYITQLEAQFTRYKLEKVANMSSTYAIRLYELIIQWGSVGQREVELDWLKKALVVEDDYPRLFDFKKWVIDVALSQINEYSDLTASYTQRKTGRVVTHLIFTFALKEEAEPDKPSAKAKETHAEIRESDLFKRLRGHGIGDRLAVAWILQDEARAKATVEYVEDRAKRSQIKGSTAGYLRTLFEDGAEVGKSAFEAGLEARTREAADAARRAEAEKRGKAKADREAKDRAKATVLALAQDARRALADEYCEGGASVRSAWDEKKGGFRDAMENIAFNLWLQKRVAG
jgi:plasmid replication initiation protein